MHASDRPRSRAQDIRLPVPPDLPDDPLPLLQPLRSLQLLGRGEHVDVERSVRVAAVVPHWDDFRAGQNHGHRRVVFVVLALLVLLLGVLQMFLLGRPGGGGAGGAGASARLAGDADDQQAERQHQAETHAQHKVQAEALWVG